jgi:RNA polymerase sigma factor (sigma-70 family)
MVRVPPRSLRAVALRAGRRLGQQAAIPGRLLEADVEDTPGQRCDSPGREILTAHYPLIQRTLGRVAAARRLSRDAADELRSLLHLKLLENDCVVLRKFGGRSSLETYLTTVITRIYFDQQIAAWGKWRPSMQARRQGPVAIRLERLITRDGLTVAQATQVLRSDHRVAEAPRVLEQMALTFPRRRRTRVCGHAALENLPDASIPFVLPSSEVEGANAEPVRRALSRALVSLPSGDRQLLRLRYRNGWTIARVAQELGLEQKRAYREFERVHGALRTRINKDLASAPSGRPRRPGASTQVA